LPLGDYGRADQRSHLHLFELARTPRRQASKGHVAYPYGGYFIMRDGDLYVIIRCGDVGLYGVGCHSHNDQLSFELSFGDEALVIDPGTYLYTADPVARNEFRSTAYHSTLQIDGAEQNELSEDLLFAMGDRTQARVLHWEASGRRAEFEGSHQGYRSLDPPAEHRRRIELNGEEGLVRVIDTVRCAAPRDLCWTFPLAPGDVAESADGITARFERSELEIRAPGVRLQIEEGWYSAAYGVREPTVFIRARRRSEPGEDVQVFELHPRRRDRIRQG
jgi:hypothetical protein